MRKLAIVFLALASLSGFRAHAGSESVGTTSANFLKIPSHARPAAMGEAFMALSDDEAAMTYNPAGTAKILQDQISATHIEWFQGIRLEHLGGVFGLGPLGSLGGSINWLQVDSMVKTERTANTSNPLNNYREIGSFSPHDAAFTLAYARPIRNDVNLGLSLRILQQNIDDKNGYAGSVDLGGQWCDLFEGFDIGLVARNLGSAVSVGSTPYQLPLDITGGMLYRLPHLPVAITADAGMPVDNVTSWGVGSETWVYDLLALRLGYRGGFGNQVTAGAGFRIVGFQLDYAWVPFAELGQTHRVTASYNFGHPPIGLDLERNLIGPIGDPDKRETAWVPRVQQPERVKHWVLSVFDSQGSIVSLKKGDGRPPARIVFNGKDDSGRALPDQYLPAELALDFDGGVQSSERGPKVELDSTPPKLSFDVTPKIHRPDGSGAIVIPAHFALAATDRHNVSAWSMEIRKKSGELFRSYGGQGNPPAEVVWDGNDDAGTPVSSGQVYICRMYARDGLGNKGESDPIAQVVLLKEVHFQMASDALFEVGKADVRISAFQQMKDMKVKIMQYLAPGGVIEIVGHTDSMPVHNSAYGSNEALSLARAQAVVKFFVTLLGMDEKQFKPMGKGDTVPLTTNDTPEGREKNRRVEIVIHGTAYE